MRNWPKFKRLKWIGGKRYFYKREEKNKNQNEISYFRLWKQRKNWEITDWKILNMYNSSTESQNGTSRCLGWGFEKFLIIYFYLILIFRPWEELPCPTCLLQKWFQHLVVWRKNRNELVPIFLFLCWKFACYDDESNSEFCKYNKNQDIL